MILINSKVTLTSRQNTYSTLRCSRESPTFIVMIKCPQDTAYLIINFISLSNSQRGVKSKDYISFK